MRILLKILGDFKRKLIVLFVLFTSQNYAFSKCNFNNPNEILQKIKSQHPIVIKSKAKTEVVKSEVEISKQSPNPEIDVEAAGGSSIEGDTQTISAAYKHVFELGGKRNSRIEVSSKKVEHAQLEEKVKTEETVVESVIMMYRLRQIYELVPQYENALEIFQRILNKFKRRSSNSPQELVEMSTLELAINAYKLKVSNLKTEKTELSGHLSLFIGEKCVISKDSLPKRFKSKLSNDHKVQNIKKNTSIAAILKELELNSSKLKLEKSNGVPNLFIGPTYEFEKVNVGKSHSVGLALTIELPMFDRKKGEQFEVKKRREYLRKKLDLSKKDLNFDLSSWTNKYLRFHNSLENSLTIRDIEKKQARIEKFFKRGVVPSSMVIESHRQLIEFLTNRFEFELGIIESLWNIYKIQGNVLKAKI